MVSFQPCSIKALPTHLLFHAAADAITVNYANAVLMAPALLGLADGLPNPLRVAAMTSKLWPATGVDLAVGFLESTPKDLADRIVSHCNAWGARGANVRFRWTKNAADADVRITRELGGFWSFLGTDIRSVDRSEPTMCLQEFTMATPENEYRRVVRHEAGHSLGLVHEHSRKEIVDRLDPAKVLAYFGGSPNYWSAEMIYQQILTPISEALLTATPHAEESSAMAYWFDANLTRDGRPIVGGSDITDRDYELIGKLLPPSRRKPPEPPAPPTPPPPPTAGLQPLTLGGPAVLVDVPAGSGPARFLLTLTSPAAFALSVGAMPSGGSDPIVTGGRQGGVIAIPVPTAAGWASIQAAAGEWEFWVKPVGLADGRPVKVWARAVGAGLGRSAEAAPMVLA